MKKTTRNYIWVLIANAVLIAGAVGIWQTSLQAATPVKPVLQGEFKFVKMKEKPEIVPEATYLAGLKEGKTLKSLKGDWVILNLWATWCAPCVAELPSLQKLSDTYEGKGLRVVAISVDNAPDLEALKAQIARTKMSKIAVAQNWDANGEVSEKLWPESVPTTYIISPQGRVIAVLEGSVDWASDDANAFVGSLLEKPKASPFKALTSAPAPL